MDLLPDDGTLKGESKAWLRSASKSVMEGLVLMDLAGNPLGRRGDPGLLTDTHELTTVIRNRASEHCYEWHN
jgi:hypothetical protein